MMMMMMLIQHQLTTMLVMMVVAAVVVVVPFLPTTNAAALADPATVAVGDQICYEGYIMDRYCIDRGTLLDTGDVTLQFPGQHTVHCLIDVSVCRNSEYEILGDPSSSGQMYTRAFQLDDAGKAGIQLLAARTGTSCSECTGEGKLIRGFRAQVYGTVTALSTTTGLPPTITILDATASHDLASGTACDNLTFPAQNPEFGTTGGGGATTPTVPTAPTIATSPTTMVAAPTAVAASPVVVTTPVAAPAVVTTPVAAPAVVTTPVAAPVAATAATSTQGSATAEEKSSTNAGTIVKVLTLLALAGVCILSLFGNQIFGTGTKTTTTTTTAGATKTVVINDKSKETKKQEGAKQDDSPDEDAV